ncbi:CDP-glycerol glycerophosphotransferase family protein [Escherichia coli]
MIILRKAAHVVFDNLLSVFCLPFKLNNRVCIFNSTGNVNYNFNSRFLFEFITKQCDSQLMCYFVVNDDVLREKLLNSGHRNIISSKSFKNKVLILQAKAWICSTIEPPVGCFIKRRQRIVYHLGHGVPLKNIGMAENQISLVKRINRYIKLRMFSHVTCYSLFFKDVLYRAFNKNDAIDYLFLGQPRNDTILAESGECKIDLTISSLGSFSEKEFFQSKKILYCPTWRNYAKTRFFPFTDFDPIELNRFLEQKNIIIFTREHPYYKFEKPRGIENIKRIVPLNADVLPDVTPYLSCFDLMITDYSSIFIDFMITEKPVAFIPYDLEKYEKLVGFSKPYKEITSGKYIHSFSQFLHVIGNDSFSGYTKEYLSNFNVKSRGNCLEHYLKIQELIKLD